MKTYFRNVAPQHRFNTSFQRIWICRNSSNSLHLYEFIWSSFQTNNWALPSLSFHLCTKPTPIMRPARSGVYDSRQVGLVHFTRKVGGLWLPAGLDSSVRAVGQGRAGVLMKWRRISLVESHSVLWNLSMSFWGSRLYIWSDKLRRTDLCLSLETS